MVINDGERIKKVRRYRRLVQLMFEEVCMECSDLDTCSKACDRLMAEIKEYPLSEDFINIQLTVHLHGWKAYKKYFPSQYGVEYKEAIALAKNLNGLAQLKKELKEKKIRLNGIKKELNKKGLNEEYKKDLEVVARGLREQIVSLEEKYKKDVKAYYSKSAEAFLNLLEFHREILYQPWFIDIIIHAYYEDDKDLLRKVARIIQKPLDHGNVKIELEYWIRGNWEEGLELKNKSTDEIHKLADKEGLYGGYYSKDTRSLERYIQRLGLKKR